jgi:hypothetical protein
MSHEKHEKNLSRRELLGLAAGSAAGLSLASAGVAAEAAPKPRSKVRDRFWIFAVPAGSDDNYYERGNYRGGSRMTPAEGAFYLGVPNLLLIRNADHPRLPGGQQWRAKTTFEQYAISFEPLDQVVWSVVGSGGKGGLGELYPVIQLAKKFPNISGIYLDDLIIDCKKQADGRPVGKPALQPAELEAARKSMGVLKRPMDIWVTLYRQELLASHPNYRGCDPPLASFLHLFDVLTLWTWNSDELVKLDESMAALEAIAPKTCRIALGMYVWDFHNHKPVPVELMKHQCETGLKWLHEKRIHEMIFLGNTGLDLGLPSVEFARKWIKEVGDQTV